MKKKLFIFLITLFNVCLLSKTRIDSLQTVLKKISDKNGYTADTTRFYTLFDIGKEYENTLFDSAIVYFMKAEKIAKEIKNRTMLVGVLTNMSFMNYKHSNYNNAIKNSLDAIKISDEQLNNPDKNIQRKANITKSYAFNIIGACKLHQGLYPKALDYFFLSLKINEQLKSKPDQSSNLNNIGGIFLEQKEYSKALYFFSRALKINNELGMKDGMASNMGNIGIIYFNTKQYKKALTYLLNTLKISEEMNNKYIQSSTLLVIGRIYSDQLNFEKALEYNFRAFNLSQVINDKRGTVFALNDLGNSYTKLHKYNLAADYTKRALELAKEFELLESIQSSYEIFYNIYTETNRPALALESYKQYIIYRDSISNVENDKAIIQKELQYNYNKKATADSIVNAKAQEIKDAQLAKNKLEIKSKQNQQYALFGGLALVLVFAGFMYNRFKITQRQKIIIEEQKKLVDVSQKKTMDSINYAKKIQHSILPSSEQLSSIFPNHFIFFKPKDVVSGDFYWFHHQNNLSFIAVADCTGHGVPGAFMTMIGYSNLIEVVAQQKVIEPNKILENLHQHIFNNLQQNKGDAYSQDGMDISLVVIDHENSLLHFSAAYNNGYLIQNKQIHTLKATSKSIGGLSILGEIEPERNFKSETVPFTKGSLLILTTDGIFDQLNKQDEKFGNERFKELMLNFNTETTSENLNLVEQTYANWKRDAPQLDDLCLLGLVI